MEQGSALPNSLGGPLQGIPLSAWLLVICILSTLADVLLQWPGASLIGVPCLLVYFFRERAQLMGNAKILLVICLLLAGYTLWRPGGFHDLVLATSRMGYFPAFVAILSLLRASAAESATVASAGRHLVNQPPRRRYWALTLGSHLFGFLFNIGGLALLIDMTSKANTLAAAGGDPQVVAWRQRRMTLAVLRGFSCIACWVPLGVAFNLLLAVMPGLNWLDVAPYGMLMALGFMTLGWLFDQIEAPPRGQAPANRDKEPGGGRAVMGMVAHVLMLSGSAVATEELFGLPFQTVLLILVPGYSLVWLIAGNLKRHSASPVRASLSVLKTRGICRFPAYVNEIAMFATSGFMGVALTAIIPRDSLQAFIAALPLSPGGVAGAAAALMFIFGLIGINPMISASVLAGILSGLDIPGLSKPCLALALAGGWTCVIGVGPMMSSLVMTSVMIGRSPMQVGVFWNGRFCLAAIILWIAILQFLPYFI